MLFIICSLHAGPPVAVAKDDLILGDFPVTFQVNILPPTKVNFVNLGAKLKLPIHRKRLNAWRKASTNKIKKYLWSKLTLITVRLCWLDEVLISGR